MSGTPDTTTPAVTEEDRAKRADRLVARNLLRSADVVWAARVEDAIVAALADVRAAERGKADALRAAMHALAEELDRDGEHSGPARGAAYRISAARLRAIADGQR